MIVVHRLLTWTSAAVTVRGTILSNTHCTQRHRLLYYLLADNTLMSASALTLLTGNTLFIALTLLLFLQ